jgi:fused signal recognition particle receptor
MFRNIIHHYHHVDSAPEVLTRLDAIDQKLDLVLKTQETEMALADDLNNAVTSLATGFAAEHDAVAAEMAALTKALAGVTDPAITAAATQAIANVTAITGKMATDAAALTASVPAATTVPPPVVTPPAVAPTVTPPVIATPPVTAPAATPPSTPPVTATTA